MYISTRVFEILWETWKRHLISCGCLLLFTNMQLSCKHVNGGVNTWTKLGGCIYLSFLLGTVIKRPFLASEHRGRDPTWFSVRCWEKMHDLTLAPVMSG